MTSFAELGRRISSWTTRLLLCALVLLAGWGFGRQVMEWWSVEPEGTPAGVAPQDLVQEIAAWEPQLELADGHWKMAWQGSAGSFPEALALLRDRCQSLVAGVPLPSDPPGPAEQHLLALLTDSPPVAEQHGRWSLYQKEGPLALVVGTRIAEEANNPVPGAARRRIVVWGVALPHGERGWATYAFHPVEAPDCPKTGRSHESQDGEKLGRKRDPTAGQGE